MVTAVSSNGRPGAVGGTDGDPDPQVPGERRGERVASKRQDVPAAGTVEGEPLRYLAPDGTCAPRSEWAEPVADDTLLDMFRWMTITRRVDREMINLQRQGQIGVYPSCMGQEAAQVGTAFAMAQQDWVFPQYRELGLMLVRGVSQADSAHLWRGTWALGYDPFAHNVAPISIPIGTHALHATGYSVAARLDGTDVVAVACFGDGATSTGDVHAAMTFAGVMRAPVVFLVQNNRYAISVPLELQTAAPTIAHKAVGYGIAGARVDGNDVIASYVVAKQAIERARSGGGPTLLEALTYRLEAHTTSDDSTRYRDPDEVARAALEDPLVRFEKFLRAEELLDAAAVDLMSAEAEDRALEVRESIYDAPHGDPLEVFEHVYVDAAGHFDDHVMQLRTELAARDRG